MEPASTGAAARIVSSIGSTLLSRYRPVGVVRLGSPEDRAQAYRRLLDARSVFFTHIAFTSVEEQVKKKTGEWQFDFDAWLHGIHPHFGELHAALDGVRLCAPAHVIEEAEAMAYTIPMLSDEANDARERHVKAYQSFLDAARRDLNYEPRPWQLIRRRKMRRAAGEAPAQVPSRRADL